VISALVGQSNLIDTGARSSAIANAFGAQNFGPGKIPLPPYAPRYVPSAPGSTLPDKTATTNANAATTMFNAAGVLANVANAATKQPTYIIVDTTGKRKTGSNVPLDIFINSGVTPIPFSGVYP